MREPGERAIPGRITIRAGDRKVVLVKHARESARHVLLKALVFGLYVGAYPDLTVEPPRDGRYRPDLAAWDADGAPRFWAECGETGRAKLASLLRRYPNAHLVVAKQVANPRPWQELLVRLCADRLHPAPVELVNVPPDAERFIAPDGEVRIGFADVERVPIACGTRRGPAETRRGRG